MAIFKKKATKESRDQGARSPQNTPGGGISSTQSMGAAARNVSDSFSPNQPGGLPASSIPRRKTNSVSTAPQNLPGAQYPSNAGRQSPAPGGPGYPTVGMGLPTQLERAPASSVPPGNGVPAPPPGAQPVAAPPGPAPPTNPGYPWSTRQLRPYQPSTPTPPISPFPRYGFSVPPYPSHSGHILLFGGLVRDRAHNDLWSLDVRDCSLQLVKTRGDAPLPRIGHVSAIADRIMLVFGGDTKINEDDQQDSGLYVLDLRTQEWTRVPVLAGPSGRYGHAACMLGSNFYVHGGHVDGRNLDDLWSFDIRQLGNGNEKWERVSYSTPAPLARTGHTLVPYRNQLYLFGGTDGDYHYNDSWSFDIATGVWTELECIGYIPIPREGHAAAIVDDVVYVFGGRDVHGKDLGDLAAFRISNQRWYMFQNMGPAPMAKSGHSLCAAHGKVYVIGGESNQSPQMQRDDPNMVHVLDTTKIKYPADQSAPRRNRTTSDATDRRNGNTPGGPYAQQQQQQQSPFRSVDNLASRSMSPPNTGSEPRPLVIANDTTGNQQSKHFPRSESIDSAGFGRNAAAAAAAAGVRPNGVPPQRPKRDDDEEYRRAMSPSTSTEATSPPPVSAVSPAVSAVGPPAAAAAAASAAATAAGPTIRAPQPSSPTVPSHTIHPNAARNSRSPPPQIRTDENGQRPALPPDAFYFSGKSPTSGSRPTSMNGRTPSMLNARPGSVVGRPGSIVGRPGSIAGTADLVRELKAREAEADNAKRREAALRVVLSRAIQEGFVVDEPVELDDKVEDENVRKVVDALVQLKQEKANLQNEVANQMKVANDKIQDAERLQKSALHEAAYFRAKAVALENNSPADLKRVETERINDLEQQLESQTAEYEKNKNELLRLQAELQRQTDLATAATDRETDTLKRAEEAEEENARLNEELNELREKVANSDKSIRDHTERVVTLSSTHQQREAERDEYKTQLDDALSKHNEYLVIIEQAQASIAAAGTRAAELEGLHTSAKEKVAQLENELIEARRALEDKSREAEQAAERLAEMEKLHHTSREEANSLRELNTGHLNELLVLHRNAKESEDRAIKGHQEQLRALEEEKSSLLKLLREAGQRVDTTEAAVTAHRQKARDLETSHQSLRADMRAQRTKLFSVQSEMSKYRDLYSAKDAELRDRDQAVTELQTRVSLLRKMMADHGIVVTDNELENAELPSTSELETKLRDKSRAHENAQREIEELNVRLREAEEKAESLGRHVERINNRSGSSASMRSPSPGGASADNARAVEAERKVQELEEKLSLVESDYQTAVRYVKGTEKMLNRMKNELTKQKATNIQLSTELDSLRGRSPSAEPGSRLRDTGRSTPSEGELSRRLQTMQSQYSSLQAELQASQDVLAARNREVEVLRMRMDDAERECEVLREDLHQAQNRIATLLEMNQSGIHLGSDDEDERIALRRGSSASSDGATSMAFDKFTKELKQWERARSPDADGDSDDDILHGPTAALKPRAKTATSPATGTNGSPSATDAPAPPATQAPPTGHSRDSSNYSGDWHQN